MITVVPLQQFGFPFYGAAAVRILRECDLNPQFIRGVSNSMKQAKISSIDEFLQTTKICFLSQQAIYDRFLLALLEESKNL